MGTAFELFKSVTLDFLGEVQKDVANLRRSIADTIPSHSLLHSRLTRVENLSAYQQQNSITVMH